MKLQTVSTPQFSFALDTRKETSKKFTGGNFNEKRENINTENIEVSDIFVTKDVVIKVDFNY